MLEAALLYQDFIVINPSKGHCNLHVKKNICEEGTRSKDDSGRVPV